MPAGFDRCVKNGGRVRTKKLPNGKYMHICWLDGKSYAGEIHTKKKRSLKKKKPKLAKKKILRKYKKRKVK